MTGISDLQTVFGADTRATGNDDSVSLAAGVKAAGTEISTDASDNSHRGMDQTVVSSTGGAMLQAMGTSDVRADKVASLQAAIANGTYNVSSADVAHKLINTMLSKG